MGIKTQKRVAESCRLVKGSAANVNNSPLSYQPKASFAIRADRFPAVNWEAHC